MRTALIQVLPLLILERYSSIPTRIVINGDAVHGALPGWMDGNYKLVYLVEVRAGSMGQFTQLTSTNMSLFEDTLTVTHTYSDRAPTESELLAYAASRRAQKSVSGTALGQNPIPTDLDTRSILLGAYAKSLATPAFTMKWRQQNGTVTTLNATQIQAAAQQVGNFLVGCVNAEIDAIEGIRGGTITTIADIDELFDGVTV